MWGWRYCINALYTTASNVFNESVFVKLSRHCKLQTGKLSPQSFTTETAQSKDNIHHYRSACVGRAALDIDITGRLLAPPPGGLPCISNNSNTTHSQPGLLNDFQKIRYQNYQIFYCSHFRFEKIDYRFRNCTSCSRDVNTRVRWILRPEPSIPGPDRDPKGPKQTHLRRVG